MDDVKNNAEIIPAPIDYSQPIRDLMDDESKPMEEPVMSMIGGKAAVTKMVTLTLGRACIGALNARKQDEEITPEQSGERFEVIKKIKAGKALTSVEKALIITQSKRFQTPMVAGQITDMLEAAK